MINSIKKIITDPIAYLGGLFLFYFSACIYILPLDMATFFDPFSYFYKSVFWSIKHAIKKGYYEEIIFHSLFFIITFSLGTIIFWGLRNYKKWSWIFSFLLFPFIIFIYNLFGLNFLFWLFSSEPCENGNSTDAVISCGRAINHPYFAFVFIGINFVLLYLFYFLAENRGKYNVKSRLILPIFYMLFIAYIIFFVYSLYYLFVFEPMIAKGG